MAVSNPAVPNIHSAPGTNAGFYEKLNTRWHERGLQIFMLIVLGALGRASCPGLPDLCHGMAAPEGQWACSVCGIPWLIQTETLHYGYALVMLIGIWVFRKGFTGRFAHLVDGGVLDPVLASHRAFSADLAGDDSPQFLGKAGALQRPAVDLPAGRTPSFLQLDRVHPDGHRACITTCFRPRVSRGTWPAPASGAAHDSAKAA